MNALFFFLGVLAGAGMAVMVSDIWLERSQAAHFEQMLDQIKSLGPRA